MSVRTVNAGIWKPTELYSIEPWTEGPPFYNQLDLSLTISGSRSYTFDGVTQSETLSYTKTVTLYRQALQLFDSPANSQFAGEGPAYDGFDQGFFILDPPAAGYFQAATGIVSALKIGQQILLLFVPTFDPEVCGTWSETGNPDPADDDSGDITIDSFPNLFWWHESVSFPESARSPFERWGASMSVPSHFEAPVSEDVGYDVTGWTNADWRSKLGTYSITYNEPEWAFPDGTTSVSATFEWTLS